MVRPGMARPVVFPKKRRLKEDIVFGGRSWAKNRKRKSPKENVKVPASSGDCRGRRKFMCIFLWKSYGPTTPTSPDLTSQLVILYSRKGSRV